MCSSDLFRPRYGEMASLTVSIPLQINQRNKQDRLVTEARLKADAAALRAEDARRELVEEYRSAIADYEGANAELARINKDAIPALEKASKTGFLDVRKAAAEALKKVQEK